MYSFGPVYRRKHPDALQLRRNSREWRIMNAQGVGVTFHPSFWSGRRSNFPILVMESHAACSLQRIIDDTLSAYLDRYPRLLANLTGHISWGVVNLPTSCLAASHSSSLTTPPLCACLSRHPTRLSSPPAFSFMAPRQRLPH